MVVFDLSLCRVRESSDGRTVTLLAPSGELLSVLNVRPSWSSKESALRLFDTCLSSGFVWRDDALHRIALWNPHTGLVAVDSLPDTVSYSLKRESLPKTGLPILVFPDHISSSLDRFEAVLPDSFAALSRDYQAHLG